MCKKIALNFKKKYRNFQNLKKKLPKIAWYWEKNGWKVATNGQNMLKFKTMNYLGKSKND